MHKQSIVILGHGSKSMDAIDDFNYIVELTREKLGTNNVYGAHMELATPSLEELIAELHVSGETQIVILPYFLFNGNHIKEDIPEKIKTIQKQYPHLKITFGTPIGKDPLMAELMLKKVQEIA